VNGFWCSANAKSVVTVFITEATKTWFYFLSHPNTRITARIAETKEISPEFIPFTKKVSDG
tara:strand:- start:149 stop:331 length:183 start_codon:yes stop_codon:yes gene_type:complete